jgi:CheY-like chemotaxis protein
VLLAEDNAVNQEVARIMLEGRGCRVDLAADGAQAVEALASRRYDLVFLDCQLPVMDGFVATRWVREGARASAATERTAIIALTAHAMKGDREQCLAAGMDDYLSKPFSQRQLREVMQRWLPAIDRSGLERRNPVRALAAPQTGEDAGRPDTLDRKVLEAIRALEDADTPGLLQNVIDLYLRDSSRLVTRVREAAACGDGTALLEAAHGLKSTSGNVGAGRLAGPRYYTRKPILSRPAPRP